MTPTQHAKVLEALEHHIEAALCSDDGMADRIMHMDKARKQLAAYREALSIMRSEGVGEPEATKSMARRLLWIAYSWNDHNFEAAHIEARKEAAKHGITNFDEANAWLAAPPAEQTEVKP